MKYVALLRGINVGGNRKVEMKKLKALLESSGCNNVSTYLNSGNAIFESNKKQGDIQKDIQENIKKELGFEIQTLVKSEKEIKRIAKAVPEEWKNDTEQKTDVAYLFKEIDKKETIDQLPVKKEFIDIRYVKGAIIWNVKRKDYNKSWLNKIISHKLYQSMTIRNVNTARNLASV